MTCGRCGKEFEADSAYCRFCGAAVAEPFVRRLTRLPDEGRIAGVCAGIADYFNTDVTAVRLLWVVLSIVPGVVVGGVVAYAAAWLLMPTGVSIATVEASSRRLVRPIANRRIAGVCAGVAQFIGVDPTAVRVLWVILSIYPGAVVCGVLFYLVGWLIIPTEGETQLHPISSTT